MKKPFFLIFLFFISLSAAGIYLYSPMKIEKIEIKLDKNLWGKEISEAISGSINLNSTVDEVKLEEIKEFLEKLPWVKSASVSFLKGTLNINIKEEPVKLCILSGNTTYNVGENGYLLAKRKELCKKINSYFYKGRSDFFTMETTGYLKVKNSILLEIELISTYLSKNNIIKEKPEILLTDTGVKLLYPENKIIVFLGNGGESWQNFKKLFRILDKPYSGYYDLRFSGLLIKEGEEK
ncbi:cell division protein FtsQ/DivIB [Desulfurobacterium atlanticum]|uniref:Cell division septal protein FtsQ n=1 Tax=Desulfurobacterium atlanticum TaxID=240169 RepID=A0A238YF02_9BACT|nr:FtsQ-type POTRA domain-containing protein [Desulfurobacterium atlanticum]SNR69727.1 Cell division septal protein FtsQ [Desulfurobacterium atlanticum]